MKIHGSSSTVAMASILLISLGVSLTAFAATSPSLGTASTFGVLSSTYTNTIAGTVINGDLGYTTGPAVAPTVNGTVHLVTSTYTQAGIAQGAALASLNGQACTYTFAPGVVDLSTDTTHGPIGVYTPGVYCIDGAASIGTGGITLSGSGTYIFRITGALTTVANSSVTLSGGASACDIFWTPMQAATLAANSSFIGTLIDNAGITAGANVTWTGNALAFSGTVTTAIDSITAPVCSIPVPPTPVTVTCVPSAISALTGDTISWTAVPSGGDGVSYTYEWTGTDTLAGTLNPLEKIYSTAGAKTASVVATSGGLSSVSTVCTETMISLAPVTVTCVPSAISALTGDTISWTAVPSGGDGVSYTYEWTGTDTLAGTLNPLEKIYSTAGAKTASVVATSGGLSSVSTVCTETIISARTSGGGGGGGYTPPRKPPVVIVPTPVIVPPVVTPTPVIVPLLPNTGLADDTTASKNILILSSILILLSGVVIVGLRKRMS